MDVKAIQPQPSRPSPKPLRTPTSVKLRASCDGCSLAKVKCDKRQPLCHRCASSGTVCHYSPSMRMGKTSAASRAAGVKPPTGGHRNKLSTTESTRTSSPSSISSANTQKSSFLDQHLCSFDLTTPEFEDLISKPCQILALEKEMSAGFATDWGNYTRGYHTDDAFVAPNDMLLPPSIGFSDDSICLEGRNQSLATACASFEPLLTHEESAHTFFDISEMESTSVNAISNPTPMTLPAFSNPDIQNHDCLKLAQSTLLSLNLPPTHGHAYQPLPTVDQALTTNSKAIQNLFTLLNCLCSHDPYLPFILAVISSKVLAWYQAITRASTSIPTSSGSPFAGRETAVHMPLTLGAYKLDGEYEERMKVQLVLGELQKVESLIERYRERFCKGKAGNNGDVGIYLALEQFLRGRLRETMEELRGEEG